MTTVDFVDFVDSYCSSKYGGLKVYKNPCARSVIDYVTKIKNWDDKEVFFDNGFTSLSVLAVLKEKGIRATGTVRPTWKRLID